jgi:hypothetical protein
MSSDNPRPTPFIFKGCGTNELELMNRLACNIRGTKFVSTINTTKKKKDKVVMPAISEDAATALAKGKAKAKSTKALTTSVEKKQKEAAKAQLKKDETGTVAIELSQRHGSSRMAVWLDDLISCLQHVCGSESIADDKVRQLTGNLILLGLEFAFTEKLIINEKNLKIWSQALCFVYAALCVWLCSGSLLLSADLLITM